MQLFFLHFVFCVFVCVYVCVYVHCLETEGSFSIFFIFYSHAVLSSFLSVKSILVFFSFLVFLNCFRCPFPAQICHAKGIHEKIECKNNPTLVNCEHRINLKIAKLFWINLHGTINSYRKLLQNCLYLAAVVVILLLLLFLSFFFVFLVGHGWLLTKEIGIKNLHFVYLQSEHLWSESRKIWKCSFFLIRFFVVEILSCDAILQ